MNLLAATANSSIAPWVVAVIVLASMLVGVLAYNAFRLPAPNGFGLGVSSALLSAAGSAGTCSLGLFVVFSALHLL